MDEDSEDLVCQTEDSVSQSSYKRSTIKFSRKNINVCVNIEPPVSLSRKVSFESRGEGSSNTSSQNSKSRMTNQHKASLAVAHAMAK